MSHANRRHDAIDSAKGVGIILVVFGHAWRGAQGAGLNPDAGLFRMIDSMIYAFHMPLFFFLSGLLFLEAVQKYATAPLLRARVTRLLWPMALWSWLFFGLRLLAGHAANSPVSVSEFPLVPIPPYEHLWFLWALFLCQTLLILAYASPLGSFSENPLRGGAAVMALGLALLNPYVAVPSQVFGPMVEHLPYFLAGIGAGGAAMAYPPLHRAVLAGVVFATLLGAIGLEKASVLHSLVLVLLGWFAWMGVDRGGDADPILRGLRFLGKMSLVIYLSHTIFSAALRIGLIEIGVHNLVITLISKTVIGLIGPIVLLWVARKLRIAELLGF